MIRLRIVVLLAFLALGLSAASAQAAEPLDIHVFAGQALLNAKFPNNDIVRAAFIPRLLGAWRDPASFRIIPHQIDSFEQFRRQVAEFPPDEGRPRLLVAMLSAPVLNAAATQRMLAIAGINQPYETIDELLKGRDKMRRDRIAWLPLGWVLWSSFDAIRPPGGCAPTFNWTTCAEQSGPNAYLLTQRAGDRGWPIYGAAIIAPNDKPAPDNPDADALMDWLATPAASTFLAQDFAVVPNPTIRPNRAITFKLFDGPTEIATSYDSPNPLPRPAVDPISGLFNACGRNTTCPNYLAPPGTDATMRARVSAALGD